MASFRETVILMGRFLGSPFSPYGMIRRPQSYFSGKVQVRRWNSTVSERHRAISVFTGIVQRFCICSCRAYCGGRSMTAGEKEITVSRKKVGYLKLDGLSTEWFMPPPRKGGHEQEEKCRKKFDEWLVNEKDGGFYGSVSRAEGTPERRFMAVSAVGQQLLHIREAEVQRGKFLLKRG